MREKKERDDFLRSAGQRWPRLDYYKKQLLCTLSLISGWRDLEHLSQLSGIEVKYLGGHLRVLMEQGMLIQDGPNNYQINPHITTLLERERQHAVVTKIIHAEGGVAFRPIFNSKMEYTVYNLLIGLFPNHLVFPNMALQTVFQYERMKELLEVDEFSYYLKALVDFCVTSTANYLPLIGFEVDSSFHDDPGQKERDEKKNHIFAVGGVPLLRLQPYGKPTPAAIRSQIIESIHELGSAIRQTGADSLVLQSLQKELDFDSFGVSSSSEAEPSR